MFDLTPARSFSESNPRLALRTLMLVSVLMLAGFVSPINVSAEDGDPRTLEDVGLHMVAIRNDSLDTDDDGSFDAVRVVLVLNATSGQADINMLLSASTGLRSTEQWDNRTVVGQENLSLTVDAWEVGQYSLNLRMYDPVVGDLLADIDIGTLWMDPSLSLPTLQMTLNAPATIETGDDCMVSRFFVDEVGFRYSQMGSRTFTGAPFQVFDSDAQLDCSVWPAGKYELHEFYQNGFGQTSEEVLKFSIFNRPAPAFNLSVVGDGGEIGSECKISIVAETLDPIEFATYSRDWDITPAQTAGGAASVDCSNWQPGVHKIVIVISNEEGTSSTRGINLVRLPVLEPTIEQSEIAESWPTRSLGEQLEMQQDGWYVAGGVSAFVFLLSMVMTIRKGRRKNGSIEKGLAGVDDPLTAAMMRSSVDSINPIQTVQTQSIAEPLPLLPSGGPDPQGLPIFTDADGIVWRKHADENMDWWDGSTNTWVSFSSID
ncbi:MAG: hypothetical protein HOE92_04925 [Euryarchaeota archaeon]|jgi:hypothetical protein|nr:hypothetical protein [Euryarchaeota archaeon]MBT4407139.1 hypothetical protein [Euryarchaeota archaeon]